MNLVDTIVMLLEKTVDLLETKESLMLSGILKSLQSELETMMSFVEHLAAEQLEHKQCMRRSFLNQVDTTLTGVEDILEDYLLDYASRRSKAGYITSLCFGSLKVNDNKLTSLTHEIRAYNKSLDLLGIKKTTIIEGITFTENYHDDDDDNSLVGLENDYEKLVSILLDEDAQDQTSCVNVIGICGMGGLGKTTLAKQIYNDPLVRHRFEGFSWTNIPQNYQTRNIFEDIFLQLVPESEEEMIKTFSNIDLVQQLYELQLSKKFLIVLDDVWNEDTWTCLNLAFPSKKTASKLVITTRSRQVAEKIADRGVTHTMRTLTEEDSWNLFRKKASLPIISGEMEVIGKNLVTRCNGLPLAIVLVGKLLATKRTLSEWKIAHQRIGGELVSLKFPEMSKVLALLTYDALPYHLKPCFLYLGVFPEDSDIDSKQLCRLWIAEGFIQSNSRKSNTQIDIAECYLDELIKRSMVQVQEGKTPTSKTIHLHDMMRDICLLKAKEENIMEVMDLRKSNQLRHRYPTTRRLALHIDKNEDNHLVMLKNDKIPHHLRSLFVLKLGKAITVLPALPSFKALKSLTVLCFDGLSFVKKKELKWIGELIGLRYLSLKRCLIDELPSSIGNLFNLCTLDLQVQPSTRINIPNTLWKLQRLRHLCLPLNFGVYRDEKLRLNNLINLETLKNFDASLCNAEDLDTLTNLRILRITTKGYQDHLEAITTNSKSERRQTILRKLLESPNMCKLHIDGLISDFPQAISPNLIKLVLSGTEIVADPMPTLEKFPKLRVLTLKNNAFLGKTLVFSALGFVLLKFLTLANLPNLENLSIEKGAMPSVLSLTVTKCNKLDVLPVKYTGK